MKRITNSVGTTALALTATISAAFGGNTKDAVVETPPAVSPWTFEGSMYGWLTGLDGDIGVDGLDVGFNESFLDIVDDLNMAAMLRFEARYAKWGVIVDGFYVDLGTSGNPPGRSTPGRAWAEAVHGRALSRLSGL